MQVVNWANNPEFLSEYFPQMSLAQERKEDLQPETGFVMDEKSDSLGFPSIGGFSEPGEVGEYEIREAIDTHGPGSSTKQNAYERAWGVTEAPQLVSGEGGGQDL